MGTRDPWTGSTASRLNEVEITDEAIIAYARLLAILGRRLRTHGRGDGGLICEDRTSRARPNMWRILPDGSILPDTRYNFVRRAFVTAAVPDGI